MAFLDLTKAFDSVHRPMIWKILKKYGCPDTLVTMIRTLHDDMKATVLCENNETAPFPVNTGVKQGCVIAHYFGTLQG